MKKAAIDFGFKRTGIAFTDPQEKIVSRVETVETSNVLKVLEENQPLSEIIVGFPINLKMTFTKSTYGAIDAALEIAKYFSFTPVYLMDERFTTNIASSMGKKELIDGISASILLDERLNGAKGSRVFWVIPPISKKVVNLINSFNSKRLLMIGSALRGLETLYGGTDVEIFEDDPTFFRLRSKNEKYSLHFGIIWDIILQRRDLIDLVVCEKDNFEKVREIFKDHAIIVVEGERCEGTFLVGGRWLKIERESQR
jgi:putative Holliday junction resolvase